MLGGVDLLIIMKLHRSKLSMSELPCGDVGDGVDASDILFWRFGSQG